MRNVGLDRSPFFIFAILLALAGCAPNGTFQSVVAVTNGGLGGPIEPPVPPTEPPFAYEKMAWEDGTPEKALWSIRSMEQLITSSSLYLNGASDIKTFCPNFATANGEQRINFWAMLISAIAKYESDLNPIARNAKGGTDPVTMLPLYGEGLMQLSYQDKLMNPGCAFNWEVDKSLGPLDPTKTILDPVTNLKCAVLILGTQISTAKKIVLDGSAYWPSIRSSNPAKKVNEIAAITKSLTFCQ